MRNSSFQFIAPMLSQLEFSLNNDYDKEEQSYYKNEFQIGFTRNEDEREAIVELRITIGSSEGSKNQPYTIRLVIGSVFRWNEEFPDGRIEQLLTVNAPALLVSYARPIIVNITNSSGRNAYNIPFVDFTAQSEKAEISVVAKE